MKPIKVIIAGGGTGGHIFPAIAIANALMHLQPSCDILFVGANGKMEMEKVPKEGYKIVGLDIAGFNRSSLLKNITLPFKLLKSFSQAKNVIHSFNPDMVVGVGGYASFPVLYMAQRKKIPTLIQEQNSYAGKSNKILGKKASAICVAYENMEKFFPKEKIVITGNPVRRNIVDKTVQLQQAQTFFDLQADKKTVFVFGGSLGAKSINEAMLHGFTELINQKAQIIWQTGTPFFQKAKDAVKGYEEHIKVYEFIREMDMAYVAADVIVSRAGASSIAELSIIGKPVIFVPFPFAAEDHQTHNAMALVNRNAAAMVEDHKAKFDLIPAILKLLKEENLCQQMSQHIKPLGVTDADHRIANIIFNLVK